MSVASGLLTVVADTIPPTPLQLTQDLLWFTFILALGVGVVYVGLLLWALGKHISHEPLAREKPGPRLPRRAPPPRSH